MLPAMTDLCSIGETTKRRENEKNKRKTSILAVILAKIDHFSLFFFVFSSFMSSLVAVGFLRFMFFLWRRCVIPPPSTNVFQRLSNATRSFHSLQPLDKFVVAARNDCYLRIKGKSIAKELGMVGTGLKPRSCSLLRFKP